MALLYKHDPTLHARALRAIDNLRMHSDAGVLDRAHESHAPLILAFADGSQRKTKIVAVEKKRFTTEEGAYAKVDLLYAFEPKAAKNIKRVVRRDDEVAALGRSPSPNPKERLHVSKMLLQRLVDESRPARFTFTDGTILPCRVRSFGLFEVCVDLKGGGSAVLFRHGLHRIHLGEEVLADINFGFHVQGR